MSQNSLDQKNMEDTIKLYFTENLIEVDLGVLNFTLDKEPLKKLLDSGELVKINKNSSNISSNDFDENSTLFIKPYSFDDSEIEILENFLKKNTEALGHPYKQFKLNFVSNVLYLDEVGVYLHNNLNKCINHSSNQKVLRSLSPQEKFCNILLDELSAINIEFYKYLDNLKEVKQKLEANNYNQYMIASVLECIKNINQFNQNIDISVNLGSFESVNYTTEPVKNNFEKPYSDDLERIHSVRYLPESTAATPVFNITELNDINPNDDSFGNIDVYLFKINYASGKIHSRKLNSCKCMLNPEIQNISLPNNEKFEIYTIDLSC